MSKGFYDGVRYDLERSFSRHTLSEDDSGLIRAFIAEKESVDHIGQERARKIGVHLIGWKRFIVKPFRELTLNDVLQGISVMKRSPAMRFKRDGSMYSNGVLSPTSQYDFVVTLKPFLLWLAEQEVIGISAEDIRRKVRPPDRPKASKRLRPEDIPSFDEVMRIIDSTATIRDRAMLSVLYESGCRVAELGYTWFGDLRIDEYGIKYYIEDRKNDQRRYARLTLSTAAFSSYRDLMRDAKSSDYAFTDRDGEQLTYVKIAGVLARAVEKSGVAKKVRPHMLRHARATHMVQQGFSREVIMKMFWNNLDSKMMATYVSLGEEDIDREVLGRQGIKKESEDVRAESVRPRPCGACHFVNRHDARYCNKCGLALSGEATGSQKDMLGLLKEMFKDPETRREIMGEMQNE